MGPSAGFTLRGGGSALANGNTHFWKPLQTVVIRLISVLTFLLFAHNAFLNRHLWWKCGGKKVSKGRKDEMTHIVLKYSIFLTIYPSIACVTLDFR